MKVREPLFAAAAAIFLTLAGCGTYLSSVPLLGDPVVRDDLAGEWAGEYVSPEGRSGSILFRIEANADSAIGDVLMVPAARNAAPDAAAPPIRVDRNSEFLSISFVSVQPGEVHGTLEPYRDPDCQCTALTTFTGAIAGDRIEGTFETLSAAGVLLQSGRWWVQRQ